MSLLPDIRFYERGHAARHARAVWNACSLREGRFALWDAEMGQKPDCLRECLRKAAFAGIAWSMERPAACAWINGNMGGGGCIHFIMAKEGRGMALDLGRAFLDGAGDAGFLCLAAFIPVPFRSQRAFALSLGFVSMGVLPGFCRLPGHNKVCAGELFRFDFQGGFFNGNVHFA